MTKKMITGIGIIGTILLSGCASPTVNPRIGTMDFINGKPYYLPQYAIAFQFPQEAQEVRRQGLCKKYGIFWINGTFFDIYKGAKMGQDDPIYVKRYIKELKSWKKAGKAGCIYPLSKQEYQYRLNQQNQQQANNRAYVNYKAATATKKVDYTGTVFHY